MNAAVAPTLRADPLADQTIAAILGACGDAPDWTLIGVVNRQLDQWKSNEALRGWRAGPDVPAQVAQPLEAYVRAGMHLPAWADPAKIGRA